MRWTKEDLFPCLVEGHTLFTTVTNRGYLLYTLNMLKSLRPYGWDKKLWVVCLDSESSRILEERGYHVYDVEKEQGQEKEEQEKKQEKEKEKTIYSQFCPWNAPGYDRICYLKLTVISRILSMGYRVILTDGDIVYRKDPVVDWRRWWASEEDVWIQNDSLSPKDTSNLCTGYMMIRPSEEMKDAFEVHSKEGQQRYQQCAYDNNDQTFFNRHVKPRGRIRALSLDEYPNGKMYTQSRDRIHSTAVLVHFNWIKGHLKMARMKEYRMWLLEAEEEET
jgi:hypothetical protein